MPDADAPTSNKYSEGEAVVTPLGYGESHRGLAGPEVAGDDGNTNWRRIRRSWRRRRWNLRRELDGEGRAVVVVLHGGGAESRQGGKTRERLRVTALSFH